MAWKIIHRPNTSISSRAFPSFYSEGLKQLDDHDYAAELRDAGVQKISLMVIAFDGKRVMVLPKGAPPPKKKRTAKKAAAKMTVKKMKKR